jgi:hypothetical protein
MDYYLTQCRQFAVEGRHRLLEWLPWVELRIDTIRAVLRRSLDQDDVGTGTEISHRPIPGQLDGPAHRGRTRSVVSSTSGPVTAPTGAGPWRSYFA